MRVATIAILVLPVLAGCADDEPVELESTASALTRSFQRGTANYAGTVDGEISSRGGTNGSQNFSGDTAVLTRSTRPSFESEALVRFDNLSLPAGAVVTSASMVLTFRDRVAGHTLRGHYVLNTWTQQAVNWRRRTSSLAWVTPGAKGLGTDISSASAFVDTTWIGSGVIRKTYALDATTVQRWITTPSTNLGVVLFNNTASNRELLLYTSEHATLANRPMLVINYELPDRVLPMVAMTAPQSGTTFGGNTQVTLAAAASDDVGVAGVRFVVDGLDIGTEDTTPPYEASFTTGSADAVHVITARARDAAGNTTTAAPVTIIVDYVPPDLEAPRVTLTAPATGETYGVNVPVALAATASDNVGVAGVQFVVDGANLGAEDTTPPYEATFTTGTASATHTITARARDAAGNVGTATASTITVEPPAPTVTHPRIWLDASALGELRQRAAEGDARWTALQNKCNGYLPGIVRPPDATMCQDSCTGSTICCGYQGERYYPAMLELALCYQVGKGLTPPAANTAAWAQKGAEVLTQMAAFANYTADHGYGIRNFGPGMAIGYDWLHDVISPALATTVGNRLAGWLDWYDAQLPVYNFRQHPTSNYFAGYYAAKSLTALALEGEHANAARYWDEWLALQRTAVGTHVGIAPYYTRYLDGGGWIQGWQYGPLAVRNMIEPSLAAMTAKGLDLVDDPTTPYHYAVNNALHLMHFSTPSLTMMDDRDELASFNPADPGRCPSNARVPVSTALTLTEMLRRWPVQTASGVDVAPYFQSFTRAVRSIYAPEPWQDMLYWDNAAAEADFTTLPDRSYLATNYVSMRSDWSTSATVATLRAVAYSDKDNMHQHPDAGSLAITRGNGGPRGAWTTDVPFLVNPSFLMRCYGTPPTPILSAWQENLRNDLLTTAGARSTTNGFRNSTTAGQSILIHQDTAPEPRIRIRTFEDRDGFVLARAEHLEDVFVAASGVTEWSRDLVFIRPSTLIVYDRTTSSGVAADPHLSWHFAPTPVLVASPPGTVRYDVADGAVFKGAITTVLPANPTVSAPQNFFGSNKLYGIQVRGAVEPSTRWLTVLDTAATSAAVANASRIESLNASGVLLAPPAGNHTVVLFGRGAAGTPITGPIAYAQPAAATTLIVTDLPPSTRYDVEVTVVGATHTVTITPAPSGVTTSSQGTLRVTIGADGSVR